MGGQSCSLRRRITPSGTPSSTAGKCGLHLAIQWTLPETQARMLLTKAADRVRVIDPLSSEALDCLYEEVQVDVATCIRPVYWESGPGKILGPGSVSYVAKAREPRRPRLVLALR